MDKTIKKLIPLKNTLLQSNKFKTISDQILCYMTEIPDLEEHSTSNELILLIMNLIEYLVKKKLNINKKDLLLQTMSRAIPTLSDADKIIISNAIEFIHANKLITKITRIDSVKNFLKAYICKNSTNI